MIALLYRSDSRLPPSDPCDLFGFRNKIDPGLCSAVLISHFTFTSGIHRACSDFVTKLDSSIREHQQA